MASNLLPNAGSLLLNLGVVKKSIEANKIAIKFDEKNHTALVNLGIASSDLGDILVLLSIIKKGFS